MFSTMTDADWQRVKTIFEAALERSPEERAGFVAEACAGHDTLRHEVENLLNGHERAGSFLNAPALANFSTENSQANSRVFSENQTVSGRFKVVRFIGRGGMGEVYEAMDLEVGERVALKTILPEICSEPSAIRRFRQEIQLSRRVTHPNVCRVFDVERHPGSSGEGSGSAGGITYLTMELLEGETLTQRLRRVGAMKPANALPLVVQMAEALAAAHDVGVVHRDFKPGNVMLVPNASGAGGERVVVTDFGLARTIKRDASRSDAEFSSSLTATGHFVGTPTYMAPEQLEGGELTPATDIYTLGLVIYEIVTGKRPYADDTSLAGAIRRTKEPPPSPRTLVPDLDRRWEAVIMRCLEIDPARRFSSPREISAQLQGRSFIAHPGKDAARLNDDRRGTPSARARRVMWGLGFTTMALALVIAGIGAWERWRPNRQPPPPTPMDIVQLTTDNGLTWESSLSADGKILAYSSDRGGTGNLEIWVQFVSDGRAMRVTYTDADEVEPALSPDGSRVVYRSGRGGGSIYTNSSYGGDEHFLAKFGRDPRFSPDGTKIIYWTGDEANFAQPTGKMYVIPARGGVPTPVQADFVDARYPVWGPDSQHILFMGSDNSAGPLSRSWDWQVGSVYGGKATPTHAFEIFRHDGLNLRGIPPYWTGAHVVFAALCGGSTNLWRVPLGPPDWQVASSPDRLTFGSGLESSPWSSPNGHLVFTKLESTSSVYELPLTKDGSPVGSALRRLTAASAYDTRPDISMDGRTLVFVRLAGETGKIWIKDLKTGTESLLTSSPASHVAISRDGTSVAYTTANEGKQSVFLIPVKEGGPEKVCDDCGGVLNWSPDGGRILFACDRPSRIGVLDLASGSKAILLAKEDVALEHAQYSPDGRWVAFALRKDGDHSMIMVAPIRGAVAGPESDWVALTDGKSWDDKPRWAEGGRSIIYYSNRDGSGCLWKSLFDPHAGRILVSTGVEHFHGARLSLMILSEESFNFAVGRGRLVLDADEDKGNIWMIGRSGD